MNLLAIGMALATYGIFRFRVTKLEKKKWAYSLLLVTFPFYAGDYAALINAIYVGLVVATVAFAAYQFKSTIGILILAIGYIGQTRAFFVIALCGWHTKVPKQYLRKHVLFNEFRLFS